MECTGVATSLRLFKFQKAPGAELLIGASAVTYDPHFRHLISPFPGDARLGAVSKWPAVSALLVLDSFAHPLRAQLLQSAAAH